MFVMKPEPSEHMDMHIGLSQNEMRRREENNEKQGIKGDILTKQSVHTTD